MALVYPIYLDIPMMTSFLASLEGGLIEEMNVEGKKSEDQSSNKKMGASLSTSNIFSNLLGVGVNAEIEKGNLNNVESQYSSQVKYPTASLFIRLRDILVEKEIIKQIDMSNFSQINNGDIIEFAGYAKQNPIQQIRIFLNQIIPILEPFQKYQWAELNQTLLQLKAIKPGGSIAILGNDVQIENQEKKREMIAYLESQKEINTSQTFLFTALSDVINKILPEEKRDTIIFYSGGFNILCKIYPEFIRENRVQDIHNGNWRCIGKVVDIIPKDRVIDLFSDNPIGSIAKELIPVLKNSFNQESLKMDISDREVKGPGFIIVTLAIFS